MPFWYFESIAYPLRLGIWTFISFIGTLCLLMGVVMGVLERRRALFLFFFPFVTSECYVMVAGLFHGRLSGGTAVIPVCVFGFLQIALIAYIAQRLRRGGLATWTLAFFSVSYASFACFVGQMAWTDDWL